MTPKQAYYERVAKTLIKNMERRQMEAYYCADRARRTKSIGAHAARIECPGGAP